MKKIFKKNQIIITSLALMIAVAGYLQYGKEVEDKEAAKEASLPTGEDTYEISEEELYNEGDIFTDTEDNTIENDTETPKGQENENPGEAILTGTNVGNLEFVAQVKLNREQMRSKNKETLLGIIEDTSLSAEQKQNAVDTLIGLTNIAEQEAVCEMLLEAKGFTNVVVSVVDESVEVVLDMGEVTDAKRAQIEDIVKRKTKADAQQIVITPIKVTEDGLENPK